MNRLSSPPRVPPFGFRFALTAFLLIASPLLGAAPPATVHVPFIEDRPFAEVIRKAKAEKKPILLDVVASWCGPCKYMDRTTFADPGIVDWSKKTLVAARVDAEKGEGRKISTRYAVRSFPTILFLDSSGNEIDRLSGALPAESFRENGDRILSGKGPLAEALAGLKIHWSTETAGSLAIALAQRNDVARLRPLVHRLVSEDPDLASTQTLDSFTNLIALEDFEEKLSAESADLISTYLPRLGSDPRRGVFAVILARELVRRGDFAGTRTLVNETLKVVGDSSPLSSDLLSALGNAETKAGNRDAAIAAFQKGTANAVGTGASGTVVAARQLELAEALAERGKMAEGNAAVTAALERSGDEPGALARAARIKVRLKAPAEAVALAKKAVEASHHEDAGAHAALAVALAASGDATGAATAWSHAAQIDPENAEYRRMSEKPRKKTAAPKAS